MANQLKILYFNPDWIQNNKLNVPLNKLPKDAVWDEYYIAVPEYFMEIWEAKEKLGDNYDKYYSSIIHRKELKADAKIRCVLVKLLNIIDNPKHAFLQALYEL